MGHLDPMAKEVDPNMFIDSPDQDESHRDQVGWSTGVLAPDPLELN